MIGYFHISVPIDPETGHAPDMVKKRPPAPSPLEIFDMIDTDKDGRLTRDQMPKNLQRVFDRLDKNKDNVLERGEVK
jgi:hypothetical protein